MGGALWRRRESVLWVAESLSACLNIYAFPGPRRGKGTTASKYSVGAEQAPFINLRNRRPGGAATAACSPCS